MARSSWVREVAFALALVPILIGVLLLGASESVPGTGSMVRFQVLCGVAAAGWLLAVALAPRMPEGRLVIGAVVGGALALRLLALSTSLDLSDDVHRYVFEGGLVAEGESPYAFAPDAPEREAEREAWAGAYARMNNKDVSAAYPPLTQYANAAVVSLAGGPAAGDGLHAVSAFRIAFALCDLLVLVPLFALLRRYGRSPALAVVWGWSPLVALEFAGSAHFDSLGILLLVAGLAAMPHRAPGSSVQRHRQETARSSLGSVLLAAGVLVKFLPVCAVPYALRALRRRGLAILLMVLVLALGLASPLLLEDGSLGLTRGLSAYSLRWESFSLVYRWIERPFASILERDGSFTDPRRVARMLVGVLWVATLLLAWRRTRDPVRATAIALGAFVVLTPTLHPWYLAWIVPFVALFPAASWSVLLAVAPLLYWPLGGWKSEGAWVEPVWIWPAIAVPFFALLAMEVAERARRERYGR